MVNIRVDLSMRPAKPSVTPTSSYVNPSSKCWLSNVTFDHIVSANETAILSPTLPSVVCVVCHPI